jgi:hypothetical protein
MTQALAEKAVEVTIKISRLLDGAEETERNRFTEVRFELKNCVF